MVSILLVSPRPGHDVATAERNDVLRATGLAPEQLEQVLIDDVEKHLPDFSRFDGIIVGGSPLNISNETYSDWQKHVHTELSRIVYSAIPSFFICYGNSFLVDLTGGTVGRTHPEDSGATIVSLTADGLTDRITRDLPTTFTSLTGHTENAICLGDSTVLLATGDTCPIQMIRANETTWACQFHAEMDAQAMKTRMDFYKDYGYFSPEDYDAIVSSLPSIDTTYSNRALRNFIEVCEGKR